MTREIKKVAVIGSGVVGAAIAAHITNAGLPVVLLDIVGNGVTGMRTPGLSERSVAVLTSGKMPFNKNSKGP
jgi:3-hydroxyacyl-CoA dehydrogenase